MHGHTVPASCNASRSKFDGHRLIDGYTYVSGEVQRGDANILDHAGVASSDSLEPRGPDTVDNVVAIRSVAVAAEIEQEYVIGVVKVTEFSGDGWID